MIDIEKIMISSEKLGKAMSAIGKFTEAFVEKMAKFTEWWEENSKVLAEGLKKFYDILQLDERFNSVLINNSWPPIRVLSRESKQQLVDYYLEDDVEGMKRYLKKDIFIEMDNDYFLSLNEEWSENSLLEPRKEILDEAIECHISKKYYASTMLMVSQLEGLVVDGFFHNGRFDGKRLKAYINKLYDENQTKQEEVFNNYILETVLTQFTHGEEIKSELSRHAIMHGADKKFGTFENSCKSILLFDYLQDRFSFFHIEDSKVFHRYGCRFLLGTEKNIISSKSLNGLVEGDYSPCKICMKDF